MTIKTTKTCMVVALTDSIVNVTEEQGAILVSGGFAIPADESPKAVKVEKVEEVKPAAKKTTTSKAKTTKK